MAPITRSRALAVAEGETSQPSPEQTRESSSASGQKAAPPLRKIRNAVQQAPRLAAKSKTAATITESNTMGPSRKAASQTSKAGAASQAKSDVDNANPGQMQQTPDTVKTLSRKHSIKHDRGTVEPLKVHKYSSHSLSSSSSGRSSPRVHMQKVKRKQALRAIHQEVFGWVPLSSSDMSPKRSTASRTEDQSRSPLTISTRRIDKCSPLFGMTLNCHQIFDESKSKDAGYKEDKIGGEIFKAELYKADIAELKRFESDRQKNLETNHHEAVFQHTTMMALFDRFNENYGTWCDWTAEPQWTSPDPPSGGKERLSLPTPAICVSFRLHRICTSIQESCINDIHSFMEPATGTNRAFPFFFIEAKGGLGTNNNRAAYNQTLNVASRALFNIWKFVEGSEELETRFYDEVRVFTLIATPAILIFQVHKAQKSKLKSESSQLPLEFLVKKLTTLEGDSYQKPRACGLTNAILKYGVDSLSGLLKSAIKYSASPEGKRYRQLHPYDYETRMRHDDQLSSIAEEGSTGLGEASKAGSKAQKRLSEQSHPDSDSRAASRPRTSERN